METKEAKNNISQYHHNIASSKAITAHVSIYDIYHNVITNSDFGIDGETLKSKCLKIKEIQSYMNEMGEEHPDYKKYKEAKNKIKGYLGGCYYQKFKPVHKKGELDNTYTGYMVIDVDDYAYDYTALKIKLRNNPNVAMFFTSPSGGLKIIVSTDLKPQLNKDLYQECYNRTFFSLDTGIEFDETAKSNNDLICFYGYDPEAYYNPDVKPFKCYDAATAHLIHVEESLSKVPKTKTEDVRTDDIANIPNIGKLLDKEYTDDQKKEIVDKAVIGYKLEGADDYTKWVNFNFALYALLKRDYLSVAVNLFGEEERDKLEAFDRSCSDGLNGITVGSLLRYAKIGGYTPKRKGHKFANVIDMCREEQYTLKKDGLTNWDMNHPAPNSIYPNFSIEIKTDRSGEETEEFKKRISNDNLYALMSYLGIDLSFDVIKGMKIGVIPHYQKYNGSNDEEILHNDLEDIVTINNFPKDKVNHLLRLHHSNSFNALTDMCKEVKWDGIDRIQQVKDCLKIHDGYSEWLDIAMEKWLIQCTAAWDNARTTPNPNARAAFDNVLIFTGAQGINKSSFFEGLLPKGLEDYFKGGVFLDPSRPDSIRQATKFGMVELGEIDTTFTRSAISLLKAFLSSPFDLYREAYAKKDTKKERRTSYCGSVNGMSFLRDLTGNRRYYPVALHDIDFGTYTDIDKTQLWAQVWDLYQNGATWWLDKDSDEAVIHKLVLAEHMEADPIVDELKKCFDLTILNSEDGETHTSKDLLEILGMYQDQKTVRHLNKILEGFGFISKRKKNSSNVWYLMPHHKVVGLHKSKFLRLVS